MIADRIVVTFDNTIIPAFEKLIELLHRKKRIVILTIAINGDPEINLIMPIWDAIEFMRPAVQDERQKAVERAQSHDHS